MKYPTMIRVRQQFERPQVTDIPATIAEELDRIEIASVIRPGQSVALTAGSRGIANIPGILRAVVEYLQKLGAKPYIVPTMGSHGGGTAEGQTQILASYGITEATVNAPIRASMEVVNLGATSEGYPVFLDKCASEADHIGVIGRVKPHTAFYGPIESGLMKMMMIGLGKHIGALEYHKLLLEQPYDRVVRAVGRHMRDNANIAFGVGIVENAYDETAQLQAMRPEDFEPCEEELLKLARQWLAHLPFEQADLLIVDQIGKNISGSGMDTNIVGRRRQMPAQVSPPSQPEMRYIFVRGLTEETHGNAAGIGLADFTTSRLVQSMDYRATVINCLTAGYPDGANLPVYFDTDKEVVESALKILGSRQPHEARIMRIKHTLELESLEISEPCLDETPRSPLTKDSSHTLVFDSSSNLATSCTNP